MTVQFCIKISTEANGDEKLYTADIDKLLVYTFNTKSSKTYMKV